MKTLSKLGIPNSESFICSIGANAAVGKTSLLTMLTADASNKGKNVLFITEDSTKLIFKKLKNLVNVNEKHGDIIVLQNHTSDRTITDMISDRDFDYIVLDTPSFLNDDRLYELQNLVHTKKIGAFVSNQLARFAPDDTKKLSDIKLTRTTLLSDYVLIASKHELTTFDKIKKLFFLNVPNINLNLLKNRYGKKKSVGINIDFQKINKQ